MNSITKQLQWIKNILPEPFRTEFIEDVLADNDITNLNTLNKIFMYYVIDCGDELPESVADKIYDRYIMINY